MICSNIINIIWTNLLIYYKLILAVDIHGTLIIAIVITTADNDITIGIVDIAAVVLAPPENIEHLAVPHHGPYLLYRVSLLVIQVMEVLLPR